MWENRKFESPKGERKKTKHLEMWTNNEKINMGVGLCVGQGYNYEVPFETNDVGPLIHFNSKLHFFKT